MAVAQRKADHVADDLLRRIVGGEIEVGSILPREAELADHYCVNRGVVREAIKLLEVHRLVQPRRRVGTEVLDPITSLTPEVLRAMLMPSPGQVDAGMFSDLLEVRAGLDETITGLAAARRTEADLLEFEQRLLELRDAVEDPAGYAAAMQRLAVTTARATQNRIYLMLVHWHGMVIADAGDVMLEVRHPSPNHLQGIELLVGLIRDQDAEGARSLVRAFHAYASPMLMDRAEDAAGSQ